MSELGCAIETCVCDTGESVTVHFTNPDPQPDDFIGLVSFLLRVLKFTHPAKFLTNFVTKILPFVIAVQVLETWPS
jgi:hypothetical protein